MAVGGGVGSSGEGDASQPVRGRGGRGAAQVSAIRAPWAKPGLGTLL